MFDVRVHRSCLVPLEGRFRARLIARRYAAAARARARERYRRKAKSAVIYKLVFASIINDDKCARIHTLRSCEESGTVTADRWKRRSGAAAARDARRRDTFSPSPSPPLSPPLDFNCGRPVTVRTARPGQAEPGIYPSPPTHSPQRDST